MTSEMKWHPGPWFVRARPTDDGLAVIEDGRQSGLFPITCEWSEAHLIAAAPDLYEALDLAGNILAEMIKRGQVVVGDTTGEYGEPYIGEGVMPKIDAVLRSARGEKD